MSARLSTLDTYYLVLERHGLRMNVGGVVLFDEPAGATMTLDRLRTRMAARVATLPRLRQHVRELPMGLARPVWRDDPDFVLAHHVNELTLPAPGGRGELERLVARLHREPMDLRRPLWDVWLVHGASDGLPVLYLRYHHAFVDGLRGIALAIALFDGEHAPVRAPAARPGPVDDDIAIGAAVAEDGADTLGRVWESTLDVASPFAGLNTARRLLDGALTLLDSPAPRTPLSGPTSKDHRVVLHDLDATHLRAARRAWRVDPATVVLTAVAGGLATLFAARGERCPVVRTQVPMANSRAGTFGNDSAFVVVDLPTGQLGVPDRLAAVAQSMSAARAAQLPTTRTVLGGAHSPQVAEVTAALLADSERGADALVSYLRWPRPIPPMLGFPFRTVFPVLPVGSQLGLLVAVAEVAGRASLTIATNSGVVVEVDFLAMAIRDALAELAAQV